MIYFVRGDLFESPAQTLVNTVNTVGVMGKGIALRFKKIYPDMFEEYRGLCESGELQIGRLHVWRTQHKIILNFPTKTTWRQPSHPDYIRRGLQAFRENYHHLGIHSVAFPPLGCGNGELDFAGTVRPIMEEALRDLPITVFIYAPLPRTAPAEHRTQGEIEEWLRGAPRDLPFTEVCEDVRRLLIERRRFPTLTGKSSFEAQYLDEEEAIRIWSSGRVVTIPLDLVAEVWNELRVRTMLTAEFTPSDRDQTARFIFAILAELPYVRVVSTGEDYERLRFNPTRALYLVRPESRSDQQMSFHL